MYNNSLGSSRLSFRCLLPFLLLFLLPPALSAQTSGTAALTGTVTDSTGGVIPNATVTATNTGNGQARTTMTGADGVYKISLLPPGAYKVRFEAMGFEAAEQPSVELSVTETQTLNRSLAVGSQNQQVVVEAGAEAVQTTSSTLGTVIASETVTDLPLSTRNYLNLISLSAGANANVNNADQVGKGGMFLFVNGSNNEQNNFQMDGAVVDNYFSFGTANDNGFYSSIPIPNPDAIQEFKIQTSTFDAGYGRNPGANVNVVTKSGTNSFHGTAFYFFRNSFLNANEWFNKQTELKQGEPNKPSVLSQNQYGGTFGGPIVKNKLFFFVSYQETSQRNGISAYGFQTPVLPPIPFGNRGTCTTPNWTSLAQCDAATATFVTNLATAISPNCPANATNKFDKTALGGLQVACPTQPIGPANPVTGPAGLYNINPIAINLLQLQLPSNGSYYIPGSTTGPYSVNSYSIPATYAEHQGLGNFDYVIDPKNTLSERFIYSTDPTNAPFPCGIAGVAGSCVPGSPVSFQYSQDAGTLRLTSILSQNVVNEGHVAFQRFYSTSSNGVPFTNTQVGITSLNPGITTLSQIAVNGEFQIGGAVLFGLKLAVQQWELGDQLSWTRGKHTFRFGAEYEHDRVTIKFSGLHLGSPTFQTFPDFLIARCGNVPGCALSNNTTNSNESSPGGNNILGAYDGNLESTLLTPTINAFAQDDFRVNSRLTLNLGVRWEYFGEVKDAQGKWSNTWPSLINLQPIPGTGCVQNGVVFGLGAAGTGCTLLGFEVPSNFPGPVPAGVYRFNKPYLTRTGAALDNFAPRVGFAWQPLSTPSLVVRGGAGFFFDRPNGIPVTEQGHSNVPFAFAVAQSPLETLATPFIVPPTVPGPPGTPGWTPRWVTPTGVSSNLSGNQTIAENFSNGLVYEWNLNTQWEFKPTWVLEVGYVGSHGIRETAGYTSSLNAPAGGNSTPINTAQLASPTHPVNCGYDGVAADCITTNTTGNLTLRVPYLGFTPGFAPVTNTSSSLYNALQVSVRKQLSHGLTVQAAYTWARSFVNYYIGNPDATVGGDPSFINIYAPNTYYHPQRLTINYSYDLPFGKHDGLVGEALNGWTWSGVVTIQNGVPLLITDTRLGSAFAPSGQGPYALAYLCPGATGSQIPTSGSMYSRVLTGYLSHSAFPSIPPTAGCPLPTVAGSTATAYGGGPGSNNLVPDNILGPGQSNWDMSISKTFAIKESQTLQFRTEFFNTFNHPQFNNPFVNASLGNFGQITGTSVNPRLLQFGLKYQF